MYMYIFLSKTTLMKKRVCSSINLTHHTYLVVFNKYFILFLGFYRLIKTVILYNIHPNSKHFIWYCYYHNGQEVFYIGRLKYLLHAHWTTLKIR